MRLSGRIKITPHIFYHPTYTDSQSGFRNRVEGSRERKTEHAAQCSKMKLMVCVSVKTWILEGGYITGMVSTECGVPAAHISEGHMVSQGHSLWVLEGLGKGLMLHKCLSEKDISCKNHCWEFCAFFFFHKDKLESPAKVFRTCHLERLVSYIMTTHSLVVQTGLHRPSSILNRPDAWLEELESCLWSG